MKKLSVLLASLVSLLLSWLPVQAQIHSTEQIEVELVAETTNVVPGETLWLAIRLDPIEHWHTYWKFGGDSGEATAASEWQLPPGVTVGEIQWPTPEWTPFEGTNLVTFAYEREVFLPIPVSVPADFVADELSLSTKVDYQVCDVICIPGDAVFSLSLPVADAAQIDPVWQSAFAETRASLPLTEHGFTARFNTHDGKVNIMVEAPEALFGDAEEIYFFTEQGRIMKYAPLRENMIEERRLQVSFEQHRRIPEGLAEFRGLLAVIDGNGNSTSYDINPTVTRIAWNDRIEVELLSETTNLVPGESHWLAVRLESDEGWHTYWKMAGDSGEATETTDWTAPEGTLVGDIQWPAPYWLPFPGSDLVNYGYEGEVILPIQVQLPETVEGDQVTVSTTVNWFVCELICIPGDHRLDLTLPVGSVAELDAGRGRLVTETLESLPQQEHEIEFLIAAAGERVSLGFQSSDPIFEDVADAWFFPDRRRVIANGPLRDVSIQPSMLQITHEQPRRMLADLSEIYGTLVLEDQQGNRRAYDFVDPAADANQVTIAPLAAPAGGSSSGGSTTPMAILGFMLAAMAGGFILNLMPCVFPVLSLKALAFASNAGAGVRKQRLDGLVYTGGVILSFLLLASVLIALRAGGELVGWGFQLQEPWFIALIIYLFFMMGLSLSGVFEVGTSLMSAGSSLAEHSHGYRRSFFTGVLAVIVATPCTAPFMGPALGFALTQPWLVSMLVFIALGLGMALPILILSFLPALVRFMPKPGNWMVTFKEFMAFPLYATALYFLWVLGNQVGVTGMALVLFACVLLAFAVWLYKKTRQAGFWRYGYRTVATACVILAFYLLQTPFLQPAPSLSLADADPETIAALGFEPFSTQRLDELQAAGRPVFVNMTAAWCITCLANEQTTLSTETVKQAMTDYDVTYMKGDWTNEDPEITQILNAFNRPSVPLYVLYSGNPGVEPKILPQILTPSVMLEAFAEL
jgi:thiol:disulfide interchange protein/DsbC/DsbD-like thiol-disulfide interchange protein